MSKVAKTRGAARALLSLALLAAIGGVPAWAHPLAPSLLEVREEAPGRFAVTWKTPRQSQAALQPALPHGCGPLGPPRFGGDDAALVVEMEVACERDLIGLPITVGGLATARAPVLLRIRFRDGRVVNHVLRPGEDDFGVPAKPRPVDVLWGHVKLGAEHVLGGFDHLLFLLGLFVLAPSWRRLAGMVSAFTGGHALTLTYASLTRCSLPSAAIEVLIALSIVVLAAELTRSGLETPSLLQRRPWALTSGFGLLHGLGFASALAEVGLPADEVPLALLGFNCGVEAGQLAFVLGLGVIGRALAPHLARRWHGGRLGLAYGLGSVAAFLAVERTNLLATVLGGR